MTESTEYTHEKVERMARTGEDIRPWMKSSPEKVHRKLDMHADEIDDDIFERAHALVDAGIHWMEAREVQSMAATVTWIAGTANTVIPFKDPPSKNDVAKVFGSSTHRIRANSKRLFDEVGAEGIAEALGVAVEPENVVCDDAGAHVVPTTDEAERLARLQETPHDDIDEAIEKGHLDLDEAIVQAAYDLVDCWEAWKYGRANSRVAAMTIWAAQHFVGDDTYTKIEIAEVFPTTEVTIRKNFREMVDEVGADVVAETLGVEPEAVTAAT